MKSKKLTIIDKVFNYLKNKEEAKLKDIYSALPEHTTASIRGNINRYISKNEGRGLIQRVLSKKGVYKSVSTEIVIKDNTIEVTEVKNFKVIKFPKVTRQFKRDFYQDSVNEVYCSKVSGDYNLFDYLNEVTTATTVKKALEHQEKETISTAVKEKKKSSINHLSLVGATRKDLGKEREENDFYPTPTSAVEDILKRESLDGSIWENACGDGAIAKVLKQYYPNSEIHATDLVDRGYGEKRNLDFIEDTYLDSVDNIISNPPFKLSSLFISKSLQIAKKKVIMLLKIQALEGLARYLSIFKDNCLKTVYVYTKRLSLYKNGEKGTSGTSTMCFALFVWEKGYKGQPCIDWII